jgi:uncharacterized protein (DUF2147 family)
MLRSCALILALAASGPTHASGAAGSLEGLWSNPSNSVVIRIAPCGAQLCGQVVRASASARQKAAQGGTKELVGTTLINNVRPSGADRWRGQVFLPKQNMYASGTLRLSGKVLKVQGCKMGVVCKEQTWSRLG